MRLQPPLFSATPLGFYMPIDLMPCNKRVVVKSGYYVLTRAYTDSGVYHLHPEYVEHRMTRLCRQIDFESLAECRNCKMPKDWNYIREMRQKMYPDAPALTGGTTTDAM